MDKLDKAIYEEECENVRQERNTYKENQRNPAMKFYSWLSTFFLFVGFIALILVPFTEASLLHATCFFVISYTISPTDLDHSGQIFKGIAEDLGHIRANISVIRRRGENENS